VPEPDGLAVPEGLAVREGLAVPEGLRVLAGTALGESDGPVLGVAEADPPFPVGAGLAVGGALDGGGDFLGGVTCGRSGSQDWLAGRAVRLAADAVPATPATTAAEAAVSRTPRATRAAVAGCPCAKRMRNACQCCSLLLRRSHLKRHTGATALSTPVARPFTVAIGGYGGSS
jgi:hypothetical protein